MIKKIFVAWGIFRGRIVLRGRLSRSIPGGRPPCGRGFHRTGPSWIRGLLQNSCFVASSCFGLASVRNRVSDPVPFPTESRGVVSFPVIAVAVGMAGFLAEPVPLPFIYVMVGAGPVNQSHYSFKYDPLSSPELPISLNSPPLLSYIVRFLFSLHSFLSSPLLQISFPYIFSHSSPVIISFHPI